MGNFARALHHLDMKDVKKKRLEKIAAQKLKEQKDAYEKKIIKEISKNYKSDWKREIYEGMTTGNAMVTVLPAEGEVAIDQVSPTDSASFADTNNMFGAGADNPALVDAQIRASGSGSGSTGGFNVGGDYLAFQGGSGSSRMALLKPMDATGVDTLTITAIRGTGFNGGEHPDIVGTEELFVIYKTPEMSRSSYLSQDRNQNNVGSFPADAAIIAINQGDGTLQNYTITIPEYARQKNVIFGLFQLGNSGSQYDHYGVTDIKFQRKTPLNVVVPLDSPEAISFVRVGTDEGDPKKRKKKLNDQLAASDEYTTTVLGNQFPGQGARIDGEDPFRSAPLTPDDVINASPVGKDEVSKSFADFKDLTDQQKISQSNEYVADYTKTFDDGTYNNPESIEILDRAIELNPKNIDAYFYRSFAYFDNQNYDDALADTEKILEIDPNNPDISYVKMIIYKEKGDLELSLEEIKKSLETNPDDSYLKDMKAEVEGQIEQEYRAKQVPPDADEEGGIVKRQTYYNQVSEKLAPEETENQQLVSTNLAQAKDLMTTTHYGRGRDGIFSKGAVDLLQDALKIEPNNPEILSNLGVAMLMDRYSSSKEGIEHLERAQALDPSVKFDFNINSWDRYDGEEQQPYAGPRIDRLGNLPYRYAREIIKNLPDQSTVRGAEYGATLDNYGENDSGSWSKYYTSKAKGYSTQNLQSELVKIARKIEDNKYWMEDISMHPYFRQDTAISVVYAPGYALGGTKWTGALNGVTYKDVEKQNKIFQNAQNNGTATLALWEKTRETSLKGKADDRIRAISSQVKGDVEQYKAYYDEYMKRGEPDAIEKVDVPEEGKFIETAQKEIIEKAISEPAKLFKLTAAEEKSYQMALELTGTNSVGYTAALPFALGTSILTGKPQQLFIAPSSAIKIAQDINADELAKVLRIDNPVPVTARETIQPSEGKTKEVITSLFGSQGGLQFNYDTETKQLYIEARKTLRTTSGGEEVQDFGDAITGTVGSQTFNPLFRLPKATGTGTKFTDIPVPTKDEVNGKISKIYLDIFTKYTEYQDFIDPVVKSGFNPIKIANVIFDGLRGKIQKTSDRQPSLMQQFNPDAPREWDPELGKSVNNYDVSIAALKQSLDQSLLADIVVTLATKYVEVQTNAIAANLVALRKIMTDIGIPASDIEKFGGAIGMVYSSTPVNFDDLPDEVKKVIEAAVGSPQGKPKSKPKPRSGSDSIAGLDEPIVFDKDKKNNVKESTLLERLKQKQFFNPKDIKPTFPENPPPELDPKTGMHPNYGKNAKRYRKLDPISANAMPPTGDPETDALVDKQRTKPKSFFKFKKNLKENQKSNWRKELIKEGEWQPVASTGPTNATAQTYGYFDGGSPVPNSETGQQVTTTVSGLGGVEATPSTTTIDLGFGETMNVDAPNYNQLALAGVAKPILMKRQETGDINKKLDASQKFAQKVGADVMMNARVDNEKTDEYTIEKEMKIVADLMNSIDQTGQIKNQKVLEKASEYNIKLKNNQAELNKRVKQIDEYRVKQSEWEKESERNAKIIKDRIKTNISKVNKFLSKYGQKLQSSYPMGAADTRIIDGGRKLVIISHSGFNYSDTKKFNVRVFEAESGKTISKKTGNFGKVSGKNLLDNVYNKGSGSGQATIMYENISGMIEEKDFEIQDIPEIKRPTPPKFMEKSIMQGWFHVMSGNAVTEDDEKFIKKFEPLAKNTIPIPFSSSTDDGIHLLPSPLPSGGLNLAAKLAVNYAKGDLTPITKSPGAGFDRVVINAIRATMEGGETEDNAPQQKDGQGTNSFFNPKTKGGAIRYDVLLSKASTIKQIGYAPVTAALGQFSIRATDKGIQITDDFDIDADSKNVGAAAILDPLTKYIGGTDVQQTANRLVGIAANRAAELGFDMTNQKGLPMASFDSLGNEIEPAFDNKGNMIRAKVETPKDYKIPINYTIPWSQIPPSVKSGMGYGNLLTNRQKRAIQRSIQKPSKAVKTIKKMAKTKSIGFDRDEPIVRRRKKKRVDK